MHIIVTGSSGFIGYHLIKKLLELGFKVTGIDNHNDYYDQILKKKRCSALKSDNFTFVNADISELKDIGNDFDIAINLAAQAGVRVSKEREYLYKKTNINGFKSFVELCEKNNINKIIYASSSSVYSDDEKKKFVEDAVNLNPKSIYGQSKLQNEIFADEFSKRQSIKFLGLRFFSVYGPWGRPDMAYFIFTESLKKGNKITLYDNGKMLRDMTYIDDIVDGIIGSVQHITSNKMLNHEIFNLGNDCPISTISLLETIEKILGIKSKRIMKASENEAFFTHANIEKAKKILAYNPKTDLNEGIRKFIEWHNWYSKNEKA